MSEDDVLRYWDSELQRWVYLSEVADAVDAAILAIDGYYNDDRESATRWLLRAAEGNENKTK